MSSWFIATWLYIICWWCIIFWSWTIWWSILAGDHGMISFYLIIFWTSYYYWIFPWLLKVRFVCHTIICLGFYSFLLLYFCCLFIYVIWTINFTNRCLWGSCVWINFVADRSSIQMIKLGVLLPFFLFEKTGHVIFWFFVVFNSLFSFLNFYLFTDKQLLLKFDLL